MTRRTLYVQLIMFMARGVVAYLVSFGRVAGRNDRFGPHRCGLGAGAADPCRSWAPGRGATLQAGFAYQRLARRRRPRRLDIDQRATRRAPWPHSAWGDQYVRCSRRTSSKTTPTTGAAEPTGARLRLRRIGAAPEAMKTALQLEGRARPGD